MSLRLFVFGETLGLFNVYSSRELLTTWSRSINLELDPNNIKGQFTGKYPTITFSPLQNLVPREYYFFFFFVFFYAEAFGKNKAQFLLNTNKY